MWAEFISYKNYKKVSPIMTEIEPQSLVKIFPIGKNTGMGVAFTDEDNTLLEATMNRVPEAEIKQWLVVQGESYGVISDKAGKAAAETVTNFLRDDEPSFARYVYFRENPMPDE